MNVSAVGIAQPVLVERRDLSISKYGQTILAYPLRDGTRIRVFIDFPLQDNAWVDGVTETREWPIEECRQVGVRFKDEWAPILQDTKFEVMA